MMIPNLNRLLTALPKLNYDLFDLYISAEPVRNEIKRQRG